MGPMPAPVELAEVDAQVNSPSIVLPKREKREIFSESCSSETDWHGIQHVSEIVGQTFGSQRIFDTAAHREIYSVLIGHLKNLKEGKYVDTQGVCCSTMVGAKGIGKTACFKTFTKLAKYICPTVFVIYVSYNCVGSEQSRLGSKSLARIIKEELISNNIQVEENNQMSLSENVIEALEKANRYLLLLVDELDQLYKLDGSKYSSAEATIHDLAYFGNQPSGMISVLVCGSSALMENLITTNCNDQIRADFPLLTTGAINLNSTKYRAKRVYSTLPIDLKSVESIVGKDGTFEENISLYRLIAYITGCSARNVERLVKDADDQSLVMGSSSPENCLTGANTLANDNISRLRDAVLKALVKKNRRLLLNIFGTSTCTSAEIVRNLALEEWEKQLLPLNYPEIELIWLKMIRKKQVRALDQGDLCYYILHLTDCCWLTISGIRDSKPEKIYPFSLSSLGAFVMTSSNKDEISKQIMEFIKNSSDSSVWKIVKNPRAHKGRTSQVIATSLAVSGICNIL